MDTSKNAGIVNPLAVSICDECEQLLEEASEAIRHHGTEVISARSMARTGGLTEKQKHDLSTSLLASFDRAHSLWGEYRQHLIEHSGRDSQ